MTLAEIMRKYVGIVEEVNPKQFGDLNNPANLAKYQQALDQDNSTSSNTPPDTKLSAAEEDDQAPENITNTSAAKPKVAATSTAAPQAGAPKIVPGA